VRLQNLVRQRLASSFPPPQSQAVSGLDIESFARALIDGNEAQARSVFVRLADAFGDERRLMLELLAPTARRVGEWWVEDECDFLEVSEAVARLGAILASLAASDSGGLNAPTMLLLTLPGETHRFGADMAADLFRREGWRVLRSDWDPARIASVDVDAVGISCGCERAATRLPQFLSEIKTMAGSRAPPVLLGGSLFEGRTERADGLGVDFVAYDADSPRRITRALFQARSEKPKSDGFDLA
jgi:methylmalonyl-CoA mutase cobalamin-binding subunit